MIYYRDSGWHVCVNKVKNCTHQASQHQCNIWRSNDGLFKWDDTGMASVKHKTQHATCNEPTIRPFQHPRQSRTLLQFRWVAGPNMAQTLPQHSHCSDKSDASNLVSPDTPRWEQKRMRWRSHGLAHRGHENSCERKGEVEEVEAVHGCAAEERRQTLTGAEMMRLVFPRAETRRILRPDTRGLKEPHLLCMQSLCTYM